jgi:hypothetical protein
MLAVCDFGCCTLSKSSKIQAMIFGLWFTKNNSNASNMLAVCQNRLRVTVDVYKALFKARHGLQSFYDPLFSKCHVVSDIAICFWCLEKRSRD